MAAEQREISIGVVGAGTMGRGIVQLFAQAGHRVVLFDAAGAAAREARDFVTGMLDRAAAKGRMATADAEAAKARIELAEELADLAGCGLVIEAIVEALEPKQRLFAELAGLLSADAVLATNTSSLSVSEIAAGVPGPERVAGLHFFNPVPLMKVAEVVRGLHTEARVVERLCHLVEASGHKPVVASDTPGFLVNHAGRGFYTEALQILREGVAEVPTVDALLREAAGFRMGPFELMDLTGLDVSFPVMRQIYEQFWQEPRFRPAPFLAQRVAAGLLGRKRGEGWYRYVEGKIQRPAEPALPEVALPPVWVCPDAPAEGNGAEDNGAEDNGAGGGSQMLRAALTAAGITPETGARPSDTALCLVAPLGRDATSTLLRHGLDPARTLAVDTFVGLAGRRTVMATPATDPAYRDAALTALALGGQAVSLIHDSPGFVVQRVLATIVNIACEIAQQRIATPADIDAAVTLGLGYPKGPLAWGDDLGPARVVAVLDGIAATTGDPRYRASLWLRRRAALGLSLLSPEG